MSKVLLLIIPIIIFLAAQTINIKIKDNSIFVGKPKIIPTECNWHQQNIYYIETEILNGLGMKCPQCNIVLPYMFEEDVYFCGCGLKMKRYNNILYCELEGDK